MPKLEIYNAAKKGEQKARGFIKKHPWESIGIAAMIGLALSWLFGRRR